MSCSITIYVGDKTLSVDDINNNGNGSNSVNVHVNANIGDYWVKVGDDIDGENDHDLLGKNFSTSGDGNIVAVDAP